MGQTLSLCPPTPCARCLSLCCLSLLPLASPPPPKCLLPLLLASSLLLPTPCYMSPSCLPPLWPVCSLAACFSALTTCPLAACPWCLLHLCCLLALPFVWAYSLTPSPLPIAYLFWAAALAPGQSVWRSWPQPMPTRARKKERWQLLAQLGWAGSGAEGEQLEWEEMADGVGCTPFPLPCHTLWVFFVCFPPHHTVSVPSPAPWATLAQDKVTTRLWLWPWA